MIPITVYGRMMLKAPLTGLRVFAGSVLWMVPFALCVDHAREAAETGAFATANAAIAETINTMLEGRVHDWQVPAWFDPLAWLPMIAAAILWLYVTQRMAMFRVGAALPLRGPVAWLRNMGEWAALGLIVPLLGITLVIGGAVLGATVEFGEPYNFYDPPVLADFFAVPLEGVGRSLWEAYYGEPLVVVLCGALVFLLAGRFMALHAAMVSGDNLRGKPPRLSILSCIVFSCFLHYFTAAAILWVVGTIGGFEIAVWTMMLVHFALVWCTLAAASGFAAASEIERSRLARRPEDDAFTTAQGGMVPDSKPGYDAADDLTARLKAWEQRRAA
ncbi:MAG: hypothetical protein AAFT19_00540 [Pseudomonadota bacterium]